MSSCCGPKAEGEEKAAHGHEHQGGCCGTGVGMGLMKWALLGLLVVLAFSYIVRSL